MQQWVPRPGNHSPTSSRSLSKENHLNQSANSSPRAQSSPNVGFCKARKLRMGFYIFKWLKKDQEKNIL